MASSESNITSADVIGNLAPRMEQSIDSKGRVFVIAELKSDELPVAFFKEKILTGRGQEAEAAFYKGTGFSILIKRDKLETCLLEGSARFARMLLPKEYKECVNFAVVGTLIYESLDKNKIATKEVAISVQRQLSGYEPWDKIIFGEKRNPKDWKSIESKNQDDILDNIDCMSDEVQTKLAWAIYTSTVVGDESLHTGQFMIKRNEQNTIIDIVRIDLGARERYLARRMEESDFKHETSYAYRHTLTSTLGGQIHKDYISFLLQHPKIKAKYLQCWLREIDIDALSAECRIEFATQLKRLPRSMQEEARSAVKEILTIKAHKIYEDLEVENLLERGISNRLFNMEKNARLVIEDELNKISLDLITKKTMRDIIFFWDKLDFPIVEDHTKNIIDSIKKSIKEKRIIVPYSSELILVLSCLLESIKNRSNIETNRDDKNILDQEIDILNELLNRFLITNKVIKYLEHLNHLKFVLLPDSGKKQATGELLGKLQNLEISLTEIFNEESLNSFAKLVSQKRTFSGPNPQNQHNEKKKDKKADQSEGLKLVESIKSLLPLSLAKPYRPESPSSPSSGV